MSVIRSYGQTDNYSKIQFDYKMERLKAWEEGKLKFGNKEESIEKLKKELNIKEKKSKEKLSNKGVLLKRINNIEKLLTNDNFLKSVDIKVLNIKKDELKKLKDELIEIIE